MNAKEKTKAQQIVLSIIAIGLWHYLAVGISQGFVTILGLFVQRISTVPYVSLQLISVVLSYQIILGAKVKFLEPIQTKGSISRIIFFIGTVGILIFFTSLSLLALWKT